MLQAGAGVGITGSGTVSDPYHITAGTDIEGVDNVTFDVTVSGAGTEVSPWKVGVAYAPTAKLDDIPDVYVPSATNGQVLSYNSALKRWEAAPPTVVTPGLLKTDESLAGDGSAGAPFQVREAAGRGLATVTAGVGLDDATINATVRHFPNATARDTADPVPTVNTLSMLDTSPGIVDFWDGSKWVTRPGQIGTDIVLGTELLVMSGFYDGRPPTLMIRNVSMDTDVNGVFDALSTEDLLGRAGVLSAVFQPTGALGFAVTLNPNLDCIDGVAYRLDTGEAYASQAVTGITLAWVY